MRLPISFLIFILGCEISGLYIVRSRIREYRVKINEIHIQISHENDLQHMLRVEKAYLENPARLEKLQQEKFPEMQITQRRQIIGDLSKYLKKRHPHSIP